MPRPAEPVTDLPLRGTLELDGVELTYPGADAPVLRDIELPRRARTDRRRDRLAPAPARAHWSTWCRGCSTSPAVRCGSTGSTYADLDPERLWSVDRPGPADARTCSPAPSRSNLLHGKPDATDEELWSALEIAQAADFVRGDGRDGLDAPIAQGGTNVCGGQRQRLAIARALVKQAGDLPVRRLVLRPRPGHRRAAARGAAAGDPRRDGGDRRPAGVHDPRRRPDPRARGRRGRRPRHPRGAARRPRRPTRRSSPPSSRAEEAA